ncbi:PREDICTED: universal stress protein A-like protein [Tarenaya hassleriana]|uniref:universal stress protein A-like protein n=1 Tax=Tarenaya hassleriana TaxID=28532 RepID=UPI00053C4B5F|nr:PREDICTED: universal stress protein A-like protein [Tarenaya hassleriana]
MAEKPPEKAAEKLTEVKTRPETKNMKLMVAMDDSENSFYALQWAIDHFSGLIPAEDTAEQGILAVVHVQQPFHHFSFPAGPGGAAAAVYISSSTMEAVRKTQREMSAALFARVLQMCRGKKINVKTAALEGDPKDMICQAIEEMHVQLLVVGSRGLGKIKRAFLGSVSDYCAHHAKCSVLIVKPPTDVAK